MPPPDPNLPSDPGSSVQFHGHGSYEARWARLKHLLSEVHNEYSRTKVELEKVKVELRQKEMELQECRDQIPRAIDTFQVSDSQILDAFVLIRDSLCNWIEALPEINGFEGSWKRIDWKMKSGTSSGLLQLQVGLQGPLDSVQTEIMERDIFRIIWENIFEHTLPGATHGQQLLLDKHMDQVRLLMPPKDPKAIIAWRSDTYREFTETNQYQQQVDICLNRTAGLVREYLAKYTFSRTIGGEHINSALIDRVLKPAASLSTKMACSLEEYWWEWGSALPRVIQASEIDKFDFIDCKTHGPVSKANASALQNGSKIGRHALAIFPGLYRQTETSAITTIKKPLMLVAVEDTPSGPHSMPKTTGFSVPASKAPQTKQNVTRSTFKPNIRP